VRQFPEPLEAAVETRFKLAELQRAAQDEASYREELRQIVAIDAAAGEERSARVRYLAARSALVLAEERVREFDEVALVQPFERSLQRKKQRMDAALEDLGRLVDYEVGEVTAAATYYMAGLYSDFSQALMQSERPADLAGAALQEYEQALEEEAYPFEEQAIEVHQKNLELMAAGVWNPWIEKSLDELARLMPGRFAKREASSGFIASVDGYAYRAPASPVATASPPADAPAAESAVPAAESAMPAAESAQPAAESAMPAAESAQPAPPAAPADADAGADAEPSAATAPESEVNDAAAN
jgi:hypothetical protein